MKGSEVIRLIVAFSFLLFFATGEAQEKREVKKGEAKKEETTKGFGLTSSRAPIDITSDIVEANQKQNTVTFKGHVVAKQENSTLYSDTLVVYYDPNAQKVKEIVAIGNVKVVQLNRRASGEKATFYQDENKVVLDGNAVVREGENVVRGERVTFYVDEERSVVEGKKGGQVSTTITPPPKKEQ